MPLQAVMLSTDTLTRIDAFALSAGDDFSTKMINTPDIARYSALVVSAARGRMAAVHPNAVVLPGKQMLPGDCYAPLNAVEALLLPRWVPPQESVATTGHWVCCRFLTILLCNLIKFRHSMGTTLRPTGCSIANPFPMSHRVGDP